MSSPLSELLLRDATGRQRKVRLGQLIGQGGAGSVYTTPDMTGVVVKIYRPDTKPEDIQKYARKLEAMLGVAPQLADLDFDGRPHDRFRGGERYVQIAWPSEIALDKQNRFVGYVMPSVAIGGTASLEAVMDERDAHRLGIPAGLGQKVTLAFQLANVIAELHSSGHYLVDIKPVNLNFYKKTLYMAILDCDGFSILGKNERFVAPQHTEEYLAPEFQRTSDPNRDPESQDRFGLGVIIFRLLNLGLHPYDGLPLDNRVPNERQEKIAENLYAYGLTPHPRMAPRKQSIHECIPIELRKMFDRAFVGRTSQRPSAKDWATILVGYARKQDGLLQQCAVNNEHLHFSGMPCGSCQQITVREALLKPPKRKPGRPRKAPAPVATVMASTKNVKLAGRSPPVAYCQQCGHSYDPADLSVHFCDQCGASLV